MKTRTRILAGLLSALLLAALTLTALASDDGSDPDGPQAPSAQETLPPPSAPASDAGIRPLSIEYIYDLRIPKDGEFHTLTSAQLRAGDAVTIWGNWDPFYSDIWVMIELEDESRARSTLLSTSGSVTLTAPVDGTYNFRVMATDHEVVGGTLTIDW